MASEPIFTSREKLLDKIASGQSTDWDLIVVGGGITGAGVMYEAARRGYRVLLLEQRDFAWGTSSRSSKMVHGGLRYLLSGDMKLTRESVSQRERMLKDMPGLVQRMGFYFTVRKRVFPGRWAFSGLLWLYDKLAGIRDHRYLQRDEMLEAFPGLDSRDLKGGCYYTDAVTDDARLVLRVLQDGIAAGGSVLNYSHVDKLLLDQGVVRGVSVQDAESGQSFELRAPIVISATGAWADQLRNQLNSEKRIRPLRGSHLVLPAERLPVRGALTLFHPQDKRPVFVFPWEGATVVGTTDIDHSEDLNVEARITAKEYDYLLEAVNSLFPQSQINAEDIIATFSGVRPVIAAENSRDPSKERRDHATWSDKGLITVSGGKLTTYQLIAHDALAAAQPWLPKVQDTQNAALNTKPVGNDRLFGRYGCRSDELKASMPEVEQQIIHGTYTSLAELRWAARHEAVVHLDDLLLRRTRLGLLLPNGGAQLFEALEKICAEEMGWGSEHWAIELKRYQQIWRQHYSLPQREEANA